MTSYYVWFVLFAICAYLIATDNSIATFVNLMFKLIQSQFERYKMMIVLHPNNPISRIMIHRRSLKMAKELMKEYGIDEKTD